MEDKHFVEESENMKKPIIPIRRANEGLVNALINAGILKVTEEGLKVKEQQANSVEGSSCTYRL